MSRLRSVLLLAVCVLLVTPVLAYGQQCVVDVVVLNWDRKVTGPISTECPGSVVHRLFGLLFGIILGRDDVGSLHSVPFGNWGAEFRYFDNPQRRDGYQFSGWKVDDGWLQWNSCTTESKFTASKYFNHHNGQIMTQVAAPNVVNVIESRREHNLNGPDGITCKNWLRQNPLIVFGAEAEVIESSGSVESTSKPIELEIYELDRRDFDEQIATLSYDPIEVLFNVQGDSCDGEWSCRGESEWVSPTSGAEEVFARLKLVVQLSKGGAAEE